MKQLNVKVTRNALYNRDNDEQKDVSLQYRLGLIGIDGMNGRGVSR